MPTSRASRHRHALAALASCAVAGFACLSWQPRWTAPAGAAAVRPADAAALVAAAEEASRGATDRAALAAAIAAWERVLAADPSHPTALATLADHAILMGTAYTPGRAEKRALYDRAMALA